MRLRRKPWARPELAACDFNVANPDERKGKWKTFFKRPDQPMDLELGCGKGGFISVLASETPNRNFIAIDIKSEVLVLAKRKIEAEFQKVNREIDNVFIMSHEIENILDMMDENDTIENIYINFCNPNTKARHKKHRLTYSRQLEKYKVFLKQNGNIYFRTDDQNLYDETLEYFKETNYNIVEHTDNIDENHPMDRIKTEHELMFRAQNISIKYIHAVKL